MTCAVRQLQARDGAGLDRAHDRLTRKYQGQSMKFEQTIDLPGASPERVWGFVMDVPSMAKCIPVATALKQSWNNATKPS